MENDNDILSAVGAHLREFDHPGFGDIEREWVTTMESGSLDEAQSLCESLAVDATTTYHALGRRSHGYPSLWKAFIIASQYLDEAKTASRTGDVEEERRLRAIAITCFRDAIPMWLDLHDAGRKRH